MKRVKFTSTGVSAYQDNCVRFLIDAGFEYTDLENADFVVAGVQAELYSKKPTIIMSVGEVYTSLDSNMKVTDKPFRESDLLVIPSTNNFFQSSFIYEEARCRNHFPNHAVLRVFSPYGPDMCGYVGGFISALEHDREVRVRHSVHRTISCMFEDDFKAAFLSFVKVFLEQEVRGLYNLGSDTGITFGHLADTVYQAWHNTKDKAPVTLIEGNDFVNFHEVPDMTRFKALTGWSPKTSLRMGVWLTVQHEKQRRE